MASQDRGASVCPVSLPVPELLTPQEVADLFRWSRDNVYVKAARGQLPGVVRIGHCLRFRAAAIRSLIEAGKTPTQRRTPSRMARGAK